MIDRMPDELWTEVHDIIQETGIKTIPKKKKCKKAKWLYEEALQIVEKTREAKGKGEKQRYTHVNAQFQIICNFVPNLRTADAIIGTQAGVPMILAVLVC